MRFVVFVVLVLFPSVAHSQSVWVGVFSQYMTEHGVVLHDKPVVQANAFQGFGHGYYADLWVSRSFDGRNSEVDYTVGWSGKHLDLSIAYFDLNPTREPNDVIQTTAKLSSTPRALGAHKLAGYLVLNYTYAREVPSKNSGMWLRAGLSDAWAISPHVTVAQNFWLLHDGGVFQGESGFMTRYETSVRLRRGSYTLEPIVRLSLPFVSDRKKEIVTAIKLSR